MNDEIEQAKELLRKNNYVVYKITKGIQDAIKECEEANYEGDCLGCICSKCIAGIGE